MDKIGFILYCKDNKYHIFNFESENGVEIENIGNIAIELCNISGITIIEIIKSYEHKNLTPNIENVLDTLLWLKDKLKEEYSYSVAQLIIVELFKNLQDYFSNPEEYIASLEESTTQSFLEQLFNGTNYTQIGNSTIEHLFLSTLTTFASALIIVVKMMEYLVNDTDSEKIILLFTSLIEVQHIEYKIGLLDGEFQQMFSFSTLISFLIFEIFQIIENRIEIKKCENCQKYFTPLNRSDTIYCTRISPQDKTKTCQEYGKYIKHLKKTQTDVSTKLYKQIYNSLANKVKRQPENIEYKNQLKHFMDLSKDWKKKIKSNEKSEQDFQEWLKNQKSIYIKSKK